MDFTNPLIVPGSTVYLIQSNENIISKYTHKNCQSGTFIFQNSVFILQLLHMQLRTATIQVPNKATVLDRMTLVISYPEVP